MNLDSKLLERLTIVRFPLVVGVVFIHAYKPVVIGGEILGSIESSTISFIKDLISVRIAGIAVPIFYFISGFLFFYKFIESRQEYYRKLKSRIKTLVIPFLFWNILFFCELFIAQSIPATAIYFSGKYPPLSSLGIFDCINAIFGLTTYPIAYHFWFIRDLFLVVLIAPLIYKAITKASWFFFLILFGMWVGNLWSIYMPSITAVLFFYTGAMLSIKKLNPFILDKYGVYILISYLICSVLDTLGINYDFNKLNIILGMVSALYLTKICGVLSNTLKNSLLWLAGTSFFVYAFHEPLLSVIRKISYKLVKPSNDIAALSMYFFAPLMTVVVSIIAYIFIKKAFPKFMLVITGGRESMQYHSVS